MSWDKNQLFVLRHKVTMWRSPWLLRRSRSFELRVEILAIGPFSANCPLKSPWFCIQSPFRLRFESLAADEPRRTAEKVLTVLSNHRSEQILTYFLHNQLARLPWIVMANRPSQAWTSNYFACCKSRRCRTIGIATGNEWWMKNGSAFMAARLCFSDYTQF